MAKKTKPGIKLKLRKKPLHIPPSVKIGGQGSWEDADAEMKKELSDRANREAEAAKGKAIPVESDKPGVARHPKPQKVVKPLTASGEVVPLEIVSYHFLKLMERLAAEQGGTSAQALEDLKADIARRRE